MKKSCAICGEVFFRNPRYSNKQWENTKFCGRKCTGRNNSRVQTGVKNGPMPLKQRQNISRAHLSRGLSWFSSCEFCGVGFKVYNYRPGARFCSRKCRAQKIMPVNTRQGATPWNKGLNSQNDDRIRNMAENRKGDKNWQWKGDEVGYSGIHLWVRKHVSKPDNCTNCGDVRTLHLANLSYEYQRDVEDWAYLCVPCHSRMDRDSGHWGEATLMFGLQK